MKRMLFVCGALLLAAIPAAAQHSAADFVGTWELRSIESRSDTGEWGPWESPWPGKSVGILMYDNLGNMAVQITSSPRSTATHAEQPEFLNGYAAYYGKYEVDTIAGTVTHHRQNHLNPEFGGRSVVRYFSFDGDALTLTFAPQRTLRLHWARAR